MCCTRPDTMPFVWVCVTPDLCVLRWAFYIVFLFQLSLYCVLCCTLYANVARYKCIGRSCLRVCAQMSVYCFAHTSVCLAICTWSRMCACVNYCGCVQFDSCAHHVVCGIKPVLCYYSRDLCSDALVYIEAVSPPLSHALILPQVYQIKNHY